MELLKKIVVGLGLYALAVLLIIIFLEQAIALDTVIFLAFNSIASSFLDSAFVMITYLGSSIFWLLTIILLWMEKRKKASIYLMIAFIIDTFSLALLKTFFHRPRPSQNLSDIKQLSFDIDLGPSFPSGHTQRAFSGAAILGALFEKFRLPLIIMAVLVGVSRIYTGVHYPLDVLAGALNGIILGMTAMTFPYKKLKKGLESI
jgi:undecaprenyl-diphosphatase